MIIRSKVLKKKAICIITACLMLSVLSGCNKTGKANNDESAISAREESGDIEYDRGKVKDHTYTNSFYGISFDLPNEWHIYPMEELAKDSDVSKALVSRSVASLKEKGLIKVSISEVDKREQKLVLTDQGEKISELIDLLNEQFARRIFGNFQENEKRVLIALLKIAVANISD